MPFFVQKLTKRQSATRRNLAWGLVGITILAAGAVSWPVWAAQEQAEELPARALTVATTTVRQIDGVDYVRHYTGEIVARRRSQLGFELGGLVAEVLVDDGDRVQAGDVLARLDTALLQTQRAEVDSQCDAARALYEEMVAGPRAEKIALAKAQVRERAAQAKFWQQERDRQTELFERGATGRKEYLDAVAQAEAALAAEQVAQENLNELQAGTRKEQLAAQRATVARLKASVEQIDVSLAKSNLIAPFDGTVAQRLLDDGAVVAVGQPVIDLLEDTQLEARIGVPVTVVEQVQLSATYRLVVNGVAVPATLKAILPAVDLNTRTRTLVFTLKRGTDARLAAGQFARLALTENVTQTGFWVPMEAVVKGSRGLWAVYALMPAETNQRSEPGTNIVEQRAVEVLHSEADRVFVRGLLSDGEQIVAVGSHRIVPGQRVVPQPQTVALR